MNIEELGLEQILHPIKRVRVQYHAGKWYVEYQRKPKWILDGWWWFDDSIYADYGDAYTRAQILAAEGGVKETKHKTLEIEVKDF